MRHFSEACMNSIERRGWATDYNLHHSYGRVQFVEVMRNTTSILLRHFLSIGHLLRPMLNQLFFNDTVNEFLYENVQVYIDKLRTLNDGALTIATKSDFQSRPLKLNVKLNV